MKSRIIALFTAIAILTGSLGFVIEVPSSTPFSPFNNGARGYSEMVSFLNAEISVSLSEFNGSLILPLTHGLSDDELRYLTTFVKNGGKLIIIDEKGFSNKLLSDYMNLSVTIVPIPVYDYVLNYANNASIPLINATINNEKLTCYFFTPSSISTGKDSTVTLAESSLLSFRDIDGNGFFNSGDQFGPFAVIIKMKIGKGDVYVVSDLDAFSNNFISLGNNSEFLKLLVSNSTVSIYLGGINATFIDYVKVHARFAGGWVGGLAELGSLLVITVVALYGRRAGIFA